MSDLEAKVRITVENHTKQGFGSAAADADKAAEKIRGSGDNAARGFKAAIDSMNETMRNLSAEVKAGFEAVGNQAQHASEKVRAEVGKIGSGLSGLTGLLAGLASVGFAKSILDTADAMQSINSQVRQVTSSETEYLAVQRQLLDTANNTRASLESTASLYVSTSRALKDYGYTQQEILKFTEATNNAMTIGGVGAQQQAAALMQLSQALGSGVLQGDEFKSIAEAAPILLDTVAEYMGKSRAEIKKLGSEGKLTADVIFKAISGASEKFGEQAAKMPMTMGQALQIFRNNWQSLVGNMMNGTGIMSRVAAVIAFVANHLKELVGAAVLVGIAMLVQSFGGLTIAVGGLSGAVQGLWTLMAANPLVAATALVVGLLAATGNLGEAMDVLGSITSDVFDLIRTGYEGLGGLIEAVYNDITSAGSDSADGQTAAFGGFFSDTGEGFTGLLEKIGKVFDAFGAIIRTAVVWAIESFGDLWAAIQNGAAAAAKAAIGSIENLVNSAIFGINSVIELANKVPGISIGTVKGVNLVEKGPVQNTPKAGRSFDEIYAEEAARQQQGGLQQYFASKRPSGKSAGGRGGGGGSSGGSGKGGKGGKSHSGGSGAAKDPMQAWEEEIKAQKLAHRKMQHETLSHQEWDLAREAEYWREKLATVDANGKTGQKILEKILNLEDQLSKQSTEAKMNQVAEWEKLDKHKLEMEKDAADQALADGRISQLERLDMEIEFENRRYQIAYDALQERIALAEQDQTYSQTAIDKLKAQMAELGQGHERTQAKNEGKRENQRRKDAPNVMEMLQDGGKNVWQQAQQQMSQAFTAMLTRAQSFRQAMGGLFSAIRQTFVQEMVSKPLAALMGRFAQEGAMWLANGARQVATQSATSAAVTGLKKVETTENVGMNAIQAAAEAFKAMAGIPYVGPILAVGAAAAAMAAVYGLMSGMGGGGSSTSTTTTRIPSAAGGWDIPAGINPLTQLHENEMVLPAEHAQTIREMAGQQGGSDSTIIINSTGGDFIHKNDLAKLLKQMKRDFKFV